MELAPKIEISVGARRGFGEIQRKVRWDEALDVCGDSSVKKGSLRA